MYTRLKPLFWKSLFRALGVYRVPRRAAMDKEIGVLSDILRRDDRAAWERAVRKRSTVLPALIALLDDESQFVRSPAAEALGRVGDKSVLPALGKRLNDINASVGVAAMESVKQLGGKPRWLKQPNPYNLNDGRWVL